MTLALACMGAPTASAGESLLSGLEVRLYKGDLAAPPIDMVTLPGTRKILFTEKGIGLNWRKPQRSRIRVLNGKQLEPTPCATLRVNVRREQGAGGIALDPDFASNHLLYVYFSSFRHQDNRIARFVFRRNRCLDKEIIFKGIPTAPIHNGTQLEFVGDHLFVSTGDAMEPESAQDEESLAGKILRLNRDGTIPADNPLGENGQPTAVWTVGHRNPFGLAARPGTSQLFESENGPHCDDELNLIERGGNYGWGLDGGRDPDEYDYDCDAAQPTEPLVSWGTGTNPPDTIAPTDLAWYEGRVDKADGALLMGDFKQGQIHRFRVSDDGHVATETRRPLLDGPDGIIDVAKGPGGWIYFMTWDSIMRIVETRAP